MDDGLSKLSKSSCAQMRGSAMFELGDKINRAQMHDPASAEQVARLFLNVLNIPVRHFIIPLPDGRTPYLQRFILDEGDQSLPSAERSKVYLHIIYQSDGDRDPHDHPFDFHSTILWGSYRETDFARVCKANHIWDGAGAEEESKFVRCGCGEFTRAMPYSPKVFSPGDINVKKATQLHKLEVLKGPVVTLVRRGPRVREWGFQTDDGWEHHKAYIARKFPDAQPTEVGD